LLRIASVIGLISSLFSGCSGNSDTFDNQFQSEIKINSDGSFTNPFSYSGGDGSSVENAVQITEVTRGIDFARGVHLWVLGKCPGATVLDRTTDRNGLRFFENGGRHYVCVGVSMLDGTRQDFYFDDTEVFSRSPAGRK
jgi:hypothetical protein